MGTAWRGLGLFWAAVALLGGAAAATLQVLGPVPRPAAQVAAAPMPARAPAVRPGATEGRIAPPDAALLEPSRQFPPSMLPRVAADGRMARLVYARPFNSKDPRPRIGLIVAGIGLPDTGSRHAIDALPGPVTLAFSPYAIEADALMEFARARGHEVLASIPMESLGYPSADAGFASLMTGADPAANRRQLEWALGREQGYVGATAASDGLRGERYAETARGLASVLDEVGRRGLLYIDPRPGVPAAAGYHTRSVDLVVDDPPARAEIEAKLAGLERMARDRGSALGLAGPLRALTVERIAVWAQTLDERGLVLAPVSAMMGVTEELK